MPLTLIIPSSKEKVVRLPFLLTFMEEEKKDPGIWSEKRRERVRAENLVGIP